MALILMHGGLKIMKGFIVHKIAFVLCLFVVVFVGSCATTPVGERAKVIAIVDGYPLTQQDLFYSIQVAHRREGLGETGGINLYEYLEKLIDERLVIEEARRLGLDKDPAVTRKVDDFILRESVVMLHQDEILKKISVSDEEIRAKYKNDFEEFRLAIIEAGSEEDSKKALDFLNGGGDFQEAVNLYSTKKDRYEYDYRRRHMRQDFAEAVMRMNTGEISQIRIDNRYLVVKLLVRKEATDEDFDRFKEDIKKEILKQKEAERTAEYLEGLRKAKNVKIYEDVLEEIKNIDLSEDREEIKRLSDNKKIVVEINGHVLDSGSFIALIMEQKAKFSGAGREFDIQKAAQSALKTWIDFKLVDIEALSRQYHITTDLKDRVDSYRNRLMRDAYLREVIVPQIKPTEEDLRAYYQKNLSRYMKPVRVRLQQITVNDKEAASEIEESLKSGVDFSWLAKRRSVDGFKEKGGDAGWVELNTLPPSVREAVSSLVAGQVSPVIQVHEGYRIVKVLDRSKDEPKDFESVKDIVHTEYFGEKMKEIYDAHIANLKKDAHIEIMDDAIREIEARLKGKE